MTETYYLEEDGEALPVVAHYAHHDRSVRVLYDVEAADEFVLVWTDDGDVDRWIERHGTAHDAFARLAALAYAVEHGEFLVHAPDDPVQLGHFRREVTRFTARVTTRSATEEAT